MSWCSARYCPLTRYSPMRRHCLCSIPAGEKPGPVSFGAMRWMIGLGPDTRVRQPPMSTAMAAMASTRSHIWRHSGASCRLMAMPGTASWSKRARMGRSSWHSVGLTRGDRSTNFTPLPSHRLLLRYWHASPSSMRSRPRSVANRQISGKSFVSDEVGHWSRTCSVGYRTTCRACPAGQTWRRLCDTRCAIGTG